MKKVILSLVFVLATGSMMNATTSKENSYQESCFEKANRLTNEIAIYTNMDLGYDYIVWEIVMMNLFFLNKEISSLLGKLMISPF